MMITETEISRRIARVYDMAMAAAEREDFIVELTNDEAKIAHELLKEALGVVLLPAE